MLGSLYITVQAMILKGKYSRVRLSEIVLQQHDCVFSDVEQYLSLARRYSPYYSHFHVN